MLDMMNVRMVVMKKEIINYTLDGDDHAKGSKCLYIGYTKSIADNGEKIIHYILDIVTVIMVIMKKK